MGIKRILGILGLSCLFIASNIAHSATVTWSFSGQIEYQGLGGANPLNGVNIGDIVTGTLVYNSSAPVIYDGSGTDYATNYGLNSSIDTLVINVNGLTFQTSSNGDLYAEVLDQTGNAYADRISVTWFTYNDGPQYYLHVADEIAPYDLFSNESLPTYIDFLKAEELTPDGFGGNYGYIAMPGNQIAHFSIDSLSTSFVPVPVAIWLFSSGLIGLIGVARRKRA